MLDRLSKKPKKATNDDPNVVAKFIVEATTVSTQEKNSAAVTLGRMGGKKGGPARAKKLSAGRRKEISTKAANARWKK